MLSSPLRKGGGAGTEPSRLPISRDKDQLVLQQAASYKKAKPEDPVLTLFSVTVFCGSSVQQLIKSCCLVCWSVWRLGMCC